MKKALRMPISNGGKFEFVKFAKTGVDASFPGGGGVNHLWLKPPPQLRLVQLDVINFFLFSSKNG